MCTTRKLQLVGQQNKTYMHVVNFFSVLSLQYLFTFSYVRSTWIDDNYAYMIFVLFCIFKMYETQKIDCMYLISDTGRHATINCTTATELQLFLLLVVAVKIARSTFFTRTHSRST